MVALPPPQWPRAPARPASRALSSSAASGSEGPPARPPSPVRRRRRLESALSRRCCQAGDGQRVGPRPRPRQAEPSRSKGGDTSVVLPPSTSFSPRLPPTLPWPVNQQLTPTAVWSSSDWAAVPIGFPSVHWPVVAVSPGAPPVGIGCRPSGRCSRARRRTRPPSAGGVVRAPACLSESLSLECSPNLGRREQRFFRCSAASTASFGC